MPTDRLRRWLAHPALALVAGALLALVAAPSLAADPDDLLPVDEAFALTASAPSRDRIELEWKIADGYYLYRHRTSATPLGGFSAGTLQMPDGKRHVDEFFGEVETYRGRLQAVLPGVADAGAGSVTLEVKYQGCADIGVCYPPQKRTLTVSLPADGGATGLVLPGAAPRGLRLPGVGAGAPLPEAQAFGFEAIVGDATTLLLRFTPAEGYYLYRDRSGFRIEGAAGVAAGAPRWPEGTRYNDDYFGDQVVYFDQVDVPLPLSRADGEPAEVRVVATFQGCQDGGICYPPMTRSVSLSLPAASAAELALAADAAAGNAAPRPAAATGTGLLLALLMALAGGVILNLMPCVLPVLALKALSLADSGERARSHALWYTAGVLASFLAVGALVLALRAAGQALGWGFQLQQPLVVAVLAYVMFAVGLSLSGVFSIGLGLAGAGQSLAARQGPAGDFMTGVLAVVIASPCTAPFMVAALAFAFTAPAALAMLVFLALGLGLALPFLLIGFVPALARRLPRPGAWMDTLKQVLAFPMYLTAVWLLWVLGQQRGVDAIAIALGGLVLLALAAWWLSRLRFRKAPLQRVLALALLLLAAWPLAIVARMPVPAPATAASADGIEPWSPERLAELRAEGRVVFVDMTADWCVTCKANEKAVLSRAPFKDAMRDADAVFLQGDWTSADPRITDFLGAHGAVGVPFYIVYPAGGGEGEVLPTVLTANIVVDALRRAAAGTRP
ncbi:protein-disulfide reductase DsbD family protein [Cognatiluteimonas lumbrici]|uniref:protein-disulfide reductase DsbD family protein n=1 Tax=Cognatiluteimonas lumbrici TaxID=2559601 RepID=UPI00112C37B3|nr:protein-disulfide reductase DsbD [Luteimonas lumbrici]